MIVPKRKNSLTSNLIGAVLPQEYTNEVAWCKIFIFLKHNKAIHIGTEKHSKIFVEAVYWITRTGTQWRELPV
jgi:hypothetical protein